MLRILLICIMLSSFYGLLPVEWRILVVVFRPSGAADDALGAHRHDLDGRGLVGLPGGLDFHKTTHVVSIDHFKYRQNSPIICPVESSQHSFHINLELRITLSAIKNVLETLFSGSFLYSFTCFHVL